MTAQTAGPTGQRVGSEHAQGAAAGSGQRHGAGPATLFDRLWDAHVVTTTDDGRSLLWVDRHYVHEGSFHAFDEVARRNVEVAEPGLTVAFADHYVPVRPDAERIERAEELVENLAINAHQHGLLHYGRGDAGQGIVHVAAPELGLTLPGMLVVCGDSHTATHGALGAYAFGIGASEVAHVLANQTLWQRKPLRMRIDIEGELHSGVSAKDLVLALIARIGADGARGHAVEFAGSAVRGLCMTGRMTLCNMTIEAGGRCGLVAPDETTFKWLENRAYAPTGSTLARAQEHWQQLRSDDNAHYDRRIEIDAGAVEPTVTWGVSPEDALPVGGSVPDPGDCADAARRDYLRETLDYMGLTPGQALVSIPIDRVFIGSCTNGRLADLRAAADVLRGRSARVPGLISPGSTAVRRAAEREGLDQVFTAAGLTWAQSGCSMCVGLNGDRGDPGERIASTSNRNFRGRQGPGVRTHLMSPAMAAAAAVSGHITDVRSMDRNS